MDKEQLQRLKVEVNGLEKSNDISINGYNMNRSIHKIRRIEKSFPKTEWVSYDLLSLSSDSKVIQTIIESIETKYNHWIVRYQLDEYSYEYDSAIVWYPQIQQEQFDKLINNIL